MADLEKLASTIDGIEENVLKALAVGDAVKALDEELQSKVTEFKTEVESLKSEGSKISEKNAESLKAMSTRLEDFERRYGRAKGPNGASGQDQVPLEKTFGAQFTDVLKSDPGFYERAKSGRSTSRVDLQGATVRQHLAFSEVTKALGLSATDENVKKAMLLSDNSTITPIQRLASVMPMHGRRDVISDLIPVTPVSVGTLEYLEYMGLGMGTPITATSVASTTTVATLTSTAHGARVGDRIKVSGADEAGYNGYFFVVSVPTADTLTYTIAAATADTTTGTILWQNLSTWGSAATVAENNVKPESTLHTRNVTAYIELIAHLFRISKQMLDDVPGLQAEINSMGLRGLQALKEYKLLYGTGTSNTILGFMNHTGVQAYSQATTGDLGRMEAFRHLVTMLENVGAQATAAIANPNDWELYETSVGLDEHFMLPGGAAGSPPSLWRVPLTTTRWIEPGKILMGDFADGARLLQREGAQLSFADQDGDDFSYNRLAMRFEERLGLAITRPEFFVRLTLTT